MKVNFLGDIYLTDSVNLDQLGDADNFILSLEAPFTDQGIPKKNKVNLFMNGEYLFKTFASKKILAVNLSNNHIMDYGEEGLEYTLNVLKNKNIPYFGVGTTRNNFANPIIIGNKIALFGYTCRSTNGVFGDEHSNGAAPLDEELVLKDITKYKNNYFVILNLHWGKEHFSFPKPEDVEKARRFIDSGANLIVGNHPHKLQSSEVYKDRKIY